MNIKAWITHFERKFLGELCSWFLWIGKNGRCLKVLGATREEFFHHVRGGLTALLSALAQTNPLEPAAAITEADCSAM